MTAQTMMEMDFKMKLFNLKKEDVNIPIVTECLNFLSCNGGIEIATGRHDVNSNGIYVVVSEYTTRSACDGIWEAHRDYADLQIVLQGEEFIYVSDLKEMDTGVYVKEKDFLPCEGETKTSVYMKGAEALLLLPEDVHMPNICVGDEPSYVKKAVFKIPIELCEGNLA